MLPKLVAIIITLVTAGGFLVLGIWYVRGRALSVEEYIVARNTAGTELAIATLVASGMGAWILFAPAETGILAGLAGLIGYGIGSAAPLAVFVLLGPRMRRLMPRGHAVTEYVRHRFGPVVYYFILFVVVFYMLVFLTAELTGMAQAGRLIGGTPLVVTSTIVGLLTVIYTAYGGMRSSLFTDRIQFYVIVPLLALVLIVGVGGSGELLSAAVENTPELLSLGNLPGWEYGVSLIIANLAAEMFNQGTWQRVYTVRDVKTLRNGFIVAGMVVLPVIFLIGLFGILAVGAGNAEVPSVAMFSFVVAAMPHWFMVAILVLAMVLVMSSMDTLLNGITSALTTELARYQEDSSLLGYARTATAALIVIPVAVASQGYSVLYLFLVADLVCAAALFPVFFGMFSRHFNGWGALFSSIVGLVVGALFFPAPDFSGWNAIPGAGRLLFSFGGALVVPAVCSVGFALIARAVNAQAYDFSRLSEEVHLIGERPVAKGSGWPLFQISRERRQ